VPVLHRICSIPVFVFFVWILAACTDSVQKKQQEILDRDSVLMVYNHREASPQIDAFMKKLHQRSAFNGNVLVAKKGKILYQNAFGWANYLLKDSLTIESVFELASVSKPITATAILQLIEKGKLRLDQEVTELIPDFPYEGVTIQQLLTHRSGLPNYIYFTDTIWPDKRKGMSNDDAMSLLAQHKPAPYASPDNRFFYNNTNYMVLASIVEKVSKLSFPDYMQTHVFGPAGMKNSAVYSTAVYEKIPTKVIGHDKVWRRSVVQNFQDGTMGDKGIYSTVQDLYRFDQALRDEILLKKETQKLAYEGYNKPVRKVFNYGLGWRVYQPDDAHVVYHTGWWHGFKSLFIRDLKNDVTIVFLTNLANGSLLHLDELYKILEMPVIRQEAYSSNGEYLGK
jgi:CubicO group peptidase (beta-lactamase class C family)